MLFAFCFVKLLEYSLYSDCSGHILYIFVAVPGLACILLLSKARAFLAHPFLFRGSLRKGARTSTQFYLVHSGISSCVTYTVPTRVTALFLMSQEAQSSKAIYVLGVDPLSEFHWHVSIMFFFATIVSFGMESFL